MARFEEALAMALATEGMTFPEGFGEGLLGAYNDDLAEVNDLSGTKIAALEQSSGDMNTVINDLKIKLYDMAQSQTAGDVTNDGIDPEARETFDEDDEESAPDIDSFFTTEDDSNTDNEEDKED